MVAELVSVTVTWGRAAPPESVTAPARAPVVADWQWEGAGQATASRVERMAATSSLRRSRSEEHTSELQSLRQLVCRLLLETKASLCERMDKCSSEATTCSSRAQARQE